MSSFAAVTQKSLHHHQQTPIFEFMLLFLFLFMKIDKKNILMPNKVFLRKKKGQNAVISCFEKKKVNFAQINYVKKKDY